MKTLRPLLLVIFFVCLFTNLAGAQLKSHLAAPGAKAQPLRPYTSHNPAFVLYKPESWRVNVQESGGALRVTVSDPAGSSLAETVFAPNPDGHYNGVSLLLAKIGELKKGHPELRVSGVATCRDAGPSCAVATLAYTVEGVPIQGRYFFHADPALISIRNYSAPAERLAAQRALLLNILANFHMAGGQGGQGHAQGGAPLQFQMAQRRATDGSMSMTMPSDWNYTAAKGMVVASAPGGKTGFIFTSFSMMPQSYGVAAPPPTVIISRYLPPEQAAVKIIEKFGHHNIRVISPRADAAAGAGCVQQIGKACDAADMFITWTTPRGNECVGAFKVLSGRPSMTGQWWTIIAGIWAPQGDAARYLPMLEQVSASFRVNDQYAAGYIRDGLTHLKQQYAQTAHAVNSLYDAIHQNLADEQAREATREAGNARQDDYRRGNSYWVSDLEGGKVYATDPWGTTDTRTGDRYEGGPYKYIYFEGENPAHPSENMTEVSSNDLDRMMRR